MKNKNNVYDFYHIDTVMFGASAEPLYSYAHFSPISVIFEQTCLAKNQTSEASFLSVVWVFQTSVWVNTSHIWKNPTPVGVFHRGVGLFQTCLRLFQTSLGVFQTSV